MIHKLVLNFILGGLIFSGIYYTANIIQNQKLSAIIALIPIALICGLIINGRKQIEDYYKNAIFVLIITLLLIMLTFFLFKNTNLNKYSIIFSILILWMFLQYLRYNL